MLISPNVAVLPCVSGVTFSVGTGLPGRVAVLPELVVGPSRQLKLPFAAVYTDEYRNYRSASVDLREETEEAIHEPLLGNGESALRDVRGVSGDPGGRELERCCRKRLEVVRPENH